MVREAFAEEGPLLDQLIAQSDPSWCAVAAAILKPVFDDSERRENFRIIFAKLAGHPRSAPAMTAISWGRTAIWAAASPATTTSMRERVSRPPGWTSPISWTGRWTIRP
uniref:Uncharacterized protein n=1 Tax=Phenylobacterium glaciei TaxID=2803784 RepID=A0A974P2P9_9CAUL|nr:hypothetical protein JKL49_27080 [Phenylobacterium glaciei]